MVILVPWRDAVHLKKSHVFIYAMLYTDYLLIHCTVTKYVGASGPSNKIYWFDSHHTRYMKPKKYIDLIFFWKWKESVK